MVQRKLQIHAEYSCQIKNRKEEHNSIMEQGERLLRIHDPLFTEQIHEERQVDYRQKGIKDKVQYKEAEEGQDVLCTSKADQEERRQDILWCAFKGKSRKGEKVIS